MEIKANIKTERYKLLNNEKKIKKKNIKKLLLDFLPINLFLFSYLLYYLSLEKCLEGFDICCNKNKYIKIKLFELILSSIIISILILLKLYITFIYIIYFKLKFFNVL